MSTPTTFRKKPVEVEAMCFAIDATNATPIVDWITANDGKARHIEALSIGLSGAGQPDATRTSPDRIAIHTLEGVITASPGDWVIRGVQGEFYPCKPDIFEATYEPVSQS